MGYFEECVKGMERLIPAEWECTTWHHDVCPSYRLGNKKMFIDHPDPDKRENKGWLRFSVTNDDETSDDYQMTVLHTDNFYEAVKYMEQS